jgi:hypothetical protein
VIGEISYQIIYQGFNTSLLKEVKKKIFIPYGFKLGHFFIKDPKQARQEATIHLEYAYLQGSSEDMTQRGLSPNIVNCCSIMAI